MNGGKHACGEDVVDVYTLIASSGDRGNFTVPLTAVRPSSDDVTGGCGHGPGDKASMLSSRVLLSAVMMLRRDATGRARSVVSKSTRRTAPRLACPPPPLPRAIRGLRRCHHRCLHFHENVGRHHRASSPVSWAPHHFTVRQ